MGQRKKRAAPKPPRSALPKHVENAVLVAARHTCCKCRVERKRVQIHHIDGNRRNHVVENLAVLCFDCHDEAELKGGFGRTLKPDQVAMYRDEWNEIVCPGDMPAIVDRWPRRAPASGLPQGPIGVLLTSSDDTLFEDCSFEGFDNPIVAMGSHRTTLRRTPIRRTARRK